jgi:signal transduction histidine kinase
LIERCCGRLRQASRSKSSPGAATAAIIALGEKRRRENEQLRRAEEQLEERVKQRTRDLDHTNEELRQLTGRLMQFQDDERRRIARELHDSVGQSLAALIMNLNTVGTDIERLSQTAKAVSDSVALAQEMNKEVRTVSYLLHPPLLDEAGLASALRWYVEGFCQRSRIKVELDLPEDFGRLPQDWEIAVFRTVQECLTNIHRYSGSPLARIRLARSDSQICLEVQDKGIGITPEKLREITQAGTPGIGIRGMRERMRQLGGQLEIHSDGHGTTVE